MIRLGEKQDLVIVKQVEFGVYLAVSQEEGEEKVKKREKIMGHEAVSTTEV